MKVGFSKVCITPPIGTTMIGWSSRDLERGCESIHDDLFVRALYVSDSGREALIMGFDLCFVGREYADRFKGAIGRWMDMAPSQILMNASHTHAGPASVTRVFSDFADYPPADRFYIDEIESAVVNAACRARDSAKEAFLWAGVAKSKLPMNRRRRDETGAIYNGPNPGGVVYDDVPICLFKDADGEPISLLFSVSCHPVIFFGYDISAEYPGVAMNRLDAYLGGGGSIFLQGVGATARPSLLGKSPDGGVLDLWRMGKWEDVEASGNMVADEVIAGLGMGLSQVEPELRTAMVEMEWPLSPTVGRADYEAIVAKASRIPPDERRKDEIYPLWAARQLERLDRYGKLAESARITAQGIQLGQGLRVVALEGEATAELGHLMSDFYGDGISIPLGYSNGDGLYLVTSDMLDEGGYEPTSYWEFGYPAPLAKGMEGILTGALGELRDRGVS